MSFLEREARLQELMRREHFIEWLNCYEDFAQVGLACLPTGCPLAQYLMSSSGYLNVSVDETTTTAALTTIETPVWARRFIERVDAFESGYSITKAAALKYLHR